MRSSVFDNAWADPFILEDETMPTDTLTRNRDSPATADIQTPIATTDTPLTTEADSPLAQPPPTRFPPTQPTAKTDETPAANPATLNSQPANQHLATRSAGGRHLPRIFLTNACCLTNKVEELEQVLALNRIDIAAVTESWLKAHKEEISHLDLYKTFNKNRETGECGGVSVLIKNNIPCKVLQVDTGNHEIIWLTLRPPWLPRNISNIILAVLYYPPKTLASTRDDLIKHIINNVQQLQSKYANPGVMLMGDFNSLPVKEFTTALKLRQVVKIPTRGNNILDKILTNMHSLYKEPTSLPALGGSDHLSILWEPHGHQPTNNTTNKQFTRRFPDSSIREFGRWITQQDWHEVLNTQGTNEKCDLFYEMIWKKIDEIFPLKKRRTHPNDKPWMNSKIKQLIAERQRAHHTDNTEVKKQKARRITTEIKKAKKQYHATQMERIRSAQPRNWFNHMKRILGIKKKDVLAGISELIDEPGKCADTINSHFAAVNSTLPPLNHESLPSFLPARSTPITLTEYEVFRHLSKIPATKAPGPGDIPPRLLKEFTYELAMPFCDIFNSSLREGVFPRRWKKAYAIPVPKTNCPDSLNDLRPVSLTANPGKTLERIVAEEVWKTVLPQLDPRQFGNVKGSSCLHYLVEYIDYVASNIDNMDEVAAITIDLSKAFDLIDHSILIKKLIKLNIHENLIQWIASFISDRSLATRARGQVSFELPLHCGVPQGTVLGPLLFIIMVNENWHPSCKIFKYVDDTTIAVAYKPGVTPPIQEILQHINQWTKENNMKINPSKCAVLNYKFNDLPSTLPPLSIDDTQLKVEHSVTLLGAKLSDDLKWTDNTNMIIAKCSAKIYMLSRLKAFNVSRQDLVKIWTCFIRPSTEYVAPLWHSSLSVKDKMKIERLQKRALRIIMGTDYPGYELALQALNLPSLKDRREQLTSKFANSVLKSQRHRNLLPPKRNNVPAIRGNACNQLIETKCNRQRYFKTTVPYCTRLINKNVRDKFYRTNL